MLMDMHPRQAVESPEMTWLISWNQLDPKKEEVMDLI
jgi:hypothetical protein